MITKNQLPDKYREIIDAEIDNYEKDRIIEEIEKIPDTASIPIENTEQKWLKIKDVICVYVDMKNSTQISASSQDKSIAAAYQLFTATAIKLFRQFNAAYIDIKGDGVFALFNSNQPYTALASAITFKTFVHEVFVPKIKSRTDVDTGSHIAIDQKTLLVRRLGLKAQDGRGEWQNEVWAGKTVNMAAKLASRSEHNQLLVSERYFKNIQDKANYRCGCNTIVIFREGLHWEEYDGMPFFNSPFDFEKAYKLDDNWCEIHGASSCEYFLSLDNNENNEVREKIQDYLKSWRP